MKNCVIICNPNSGKGNKNELLKKFSGILEKSGYNIKIMYTKYSGNATEIVRHLSSDVDLVISLGGDGTFNEVVKGNLERKNALLLSHIPLGTTNDLG